MKLTTQLIEAGRSERGGFNLAQLKAIGVPLPARGWPATGWLKRMEGVEVSSEAYSRYLELRGAKRTREAQGQPDLFASTPKRLPPIAPRSNRCACGAWISLNRPGACRTCYSTARQGDLDAEDYANALYIKTGGHLD